MKYFGYTHFGRGKVGDIFSEKSVKMFSVK